MEGQSVEATIDSWVAEMTDGLSVSASSVQDRLLDLWGMLEEGETRRAVERWLTETLERNLYIADDVIGRLRSLVDLEAVGS